MRKGPTIGLEATRRTHPQRRPFRANDLILGSMQEVCAPLQRGRSQRLRLRSAGWAGLEWDQDLRVRSVWLLERSVPDFDEASDGRLEGREVAAIDAALRKPSRKGFEQSLPLLDRARLGGHRDLHRADRRLLDLDHASHDPNVTQLLTVCSAGFPCAVSAR